MNESGAWEEVRAVTCCFSGHRTIPEEKIFTMTQRLRTQVEQMYDQGYRRFVAGGAQGFDTYAALEVLRLKQRRRDAELVLALPYKKSAASASVYGRILMLADYVVYTSAHYSPSCMMARNRFMVDLSAACVCWFSGESGGTAYTVRYAEKNGLTVYNLYDAGVSASDALSPDFG